MLKSKVNRLWKKLPFGEYFLRVIWKNGTRVSDFIGLDKKKLESVEF